MPYSPDVAPLRPVPDLGGASRSGRGRRHAPRLSGQAARFLVIGGIATVVDIGLFNLLHYVLGTGPITAKVLSTVVAGVVAFVGNREFSFGDQSGRSVRRQVIAFTLVSGVALGLTLLPLAVARYGLGLTGVVALNTAANVVGLALATAFRFYGCRRWVFPPQVVVEAETGQNAAFERLAA